MMEENLFSIRLSGLAEGNFVKKKKKNEKRMSLGCWKGFISSRLWF